MMKNTNNRYVAPKAEVVAIESQGVLCASGSNAKANAGGTANNMNVNTALVW